MNPVQEKALVDDNVLNRTVESQEQYYPGSFGDSGVFVLNLASFADDTTPWGHSIWRRDRELRNFWHTEPFLAGAINAIVAARMNMSWELDGPPRTVKAVQMMLQSSNLGKGWLSLQQRVCIDLLTQDNGAFVEIIRMKDSPDSPVINLNHLDAARCERTGDIEFPVIYRSVTGEWHKMPWYSVLTFEDLETPVRVMNGIQYCFVTRVLLAAKTLRDIAVFKREKVSGRNPGEIHLVSGVKDKAITDKLNQDAERADNELYTRFQIPVIVGSVDPNANVSASTISLRNVPDGFDEDVTLRWYIAQLAVAAGADYQDFAPLPGGNLGTSNQSEILDRKSRGKGHATWRKLWEHKLNFHGVLPRSVTFRFDEQDTEQEKDTAELNKVYSESMKTFVESGIYTIDVARQIMQDVGLLKPEYLAAMQTQDRTTDVTATDSEQAPTEQEMQDAREDNQTEIIDEEMLAKALHGLIDSTLTKQVHDHANTMLVIDGDISKTIAQMQGLIPKDILHEYGIEDEHHITIEYAIDEDMIGSIANTMQGLFPLTVTFGDISLFEKDEYDVVKIEVESPELRQLQKRLRQLPHTNKPDERWPVYNPHTTLAYVLPGEGKQFIGDNPLKGETAVFDGMTLSKRDGTYQDFTIPKQKQIVDEMITDFESDMMALGQQAVDGTITQDEFEQQASQIIEPATYSAYLNAADIDEDELTEDEQDEIDGEIAIQLAALAGVYAYLRDKGETSEDPETNLENRMALWGSGILIAYTLGQLANRSQDDELIWKWTPEKDHCEDCRGLNGTVRTRREWKEFRGETGKFPGSRDLACKGFRCGCRLEET